jgi:hypothetical protein
MNMKFIDLTIILGKYNVTFNVNNICTISPKDKGSLVTMTNGKEYHVVEQLDDIEFLINPPKKLKRKNLKVGDKLVCWAVGAGYGETFTVVEGYGGQLNLLCDQTDSECPLSGIDLTDYQQLS